MNASAGIDVEAVTDLAIHEGKLYAYLTSENVIGYIDTKSGKVTMVAAGVRGNWTYTSLASSNGNLYGSEWVNGATQQFDKIDTASGAVTTLNTNLENSFPLSGVDLWGVDWTACSENPDRLYGVAIGGGYFDVVDGVTAFLLTYDISTKVGTETPLAIPGADAIVCVS